MSTGVADREPTISANAPDGGFGTASTRLRHRLLWRVGAYLVLVAAVAAVAYPFWPGRMNADTLVQIAQIRSGVYSNEYGPILEAIWSPFYKAGLGPGWVLTAQLLVFAFGAYGLLRRWFAELSAALLTALLMILPTAYGELGLLDRNTWFLALLVASFACASRALDTRGRTRLAWAGASLALAWLTLASRQNAAFAVFLIPAALAGPWLAQRITTRRLRRLWLGAAALLSGVIVTLVMMASQSVVASAFHVENTHTINQLYLYDLDLQSRRAHRDLLPTQVLPSRSLATIDADSNGISSNAMIFGPGAPVRYPLTSAANAALHRAWLNRIEHHPLAWLGERLEAYGSIVGFTTQSIWIYHPYIDPNTFGYANSYPGADATATGYMRLFSDAANNGDELFAVWLYLIASALVALALIRTRAWRRALVLALAVAPLLYQIGLFLALMGSNYTYEFPCIVLSELAVLIGLRIAWLESRSRTSRRNASASASAAGVPIS